VLPLLDPRIATLTIGHNDQETFYSPVRHYKKFLTRAIGVSDEICRKYVDECGMPAERVEWIPYGVATSDEEPVTAASGPLKLVYVGRFENTQKRISDVIKIAQKLDESGIDFTFDLVGDGEEMPAVRSELSTQMESGRVRVHGWLDSPQVIEIMRSSEVFILASAYEGFCISLTEAMANGCTPVVSDIRSGNKQLVADRENGYIVPIGDVDAFVAKIRLLADDRERLGAMRAAAWKTGREYSIDRMVDNYVSCFERAIEDARSNPRTPDPAFPLMEELPIEVSVVVAATQGEISFWFLVSSFLFLVSCFVWFVCFVVWFLVHSCWPFSDDERITTKHTKHTKQHEEEGTTEYTEYTEKERNHGRHGIHG
jgi:hypothetical protein